MGILSDSFEVEGHSISLFAPGAPAQTEATRAFFL